MCRYLHGAVGGRTWDTERAWCTVGAARWAWLSSLLGSVARLTVSEPELVEPQLWPELPELALEIITKLNTK